MNSRAAVFLDRDGTINIDTGYVCRPEQIELIPGTAAAIGKLKRGGCQVVVVTNQSAIGRGYATEEQVRRTNEELERRLIAVDSAAVLDSLLYCPHAPDFGCECRKPLTGLFTGLPDAQRQGIDLKKSAIVGDKWSDIEFGIRLGIPLSRCILVLTGHGEEEAARLADFVRRLGLPAEPAIVPSLIEAVELILGQKQHCGCNK